MKRLFQIVFMFLAFTIEVRVHALALDKECVKSQKCFFYADSLETTAMGDSEFRLKPKATVKNMSAHELELVSGRIAVRTKSYTKIKTLYGEVALNKAQAIIEVDRNQMRLISLSKGVSYRGRGQKNLTGLSPSLSVDIGRVNAQGLAEVQFPTTIETNKLVENWASFYKIKERSHFKKLMRGLVVDTVLRPHELAYTYLKTAEREQASLDLERERARLRRQKYLQETEYLRDLFKKKNYIDYSSN